MECVNGFKTTVSATQCRSCDSAREVVIALRQDSGLRRRSCSQKRRTRHPALRSRRDTTLSLAMFPLILRFQKRRWVEGILRQRGQPCQKQPSTKTTRRWATKTKSGFPKTCGGFTFQPDTPAETSRARNFHSVERLPRPRTPAIIWERFFFVKTSAIGCVSRVRALP